jgi:predicted nucleotidyltransferase
MDQTMVTMDNIRTIVNMLIETKQPKPIILFGSYAREEQTSASDLDLIVIEDTVNQDMKMVRLLKASIKKAPGVE